MIATAGTLVVIVVSSHYPSESSCPKAAPCVCPSALVEGSPTSLATTATTTAPKAPGRTTELLRPMSKADKQEAIAKEDNPAKVKATLVFKGKLAGFELELDNTTAKTITSFKGYVYGFDKMDEGMYLALGDRFVKFVSLDNTKLPPGKSKQWYESFYKLNKGTTALVEVVKIKYADGSSWER